MVLQNLNFGLPKFKHGFAELEPLVRPWYILGSSLARPWFVLGLSYVRPWFSLGVSLVLPWFVASVATARATTNSTQKLRSPIALKLHAQSEPGASLGSSSAMSVKLKWCLEDTILPLERRSMDLCSWSDGQAQTTKEDIGFLLLSLAGRKADPWLHPHLGQRPKWWWHHSRRSKVIKELLGQYPASGSIQGLSTNSVVPIVVREQQILVRYDRRSVVLAFEESAPQFESLEWILKEMRLELAQDNEGNKEEDQQEDKKEDKNEDLTEDDEDSEKQDFDENIQQALVSIKDSPGCKNAWWMASARRFKVINHLGVVKHFCVPTKSKIKKMRTSSSSSFASTNMNTSSSSTAEMSEITVRQVLVEALRFLQQEPLLESCVPLEWNNITAQTGATAATALARATATGPRGPR